MKTIHATLAASLICSLVLSDSLFAQSLNQQQYANAVMRLVQLNYGMAQQASTPADTQVSVREAVRRQLIRNIRLADN